MALPRLGGYPDPTQITQQNVLDTLGPNPTVGELLSFGANLPTDTTRSRSRSETIDPRTGRVIGESSTSASGRSPSSSVTAASQLIDAASDAQLTAAQRDLLFAQIAQISQAPEQTTRQLDIQESLGQGQLAQQETAGQRDFQLGQRGLDVQSRGQQQQFQLGQDQLGFERERFRGEQGLERERFQGEQDLTRQQLGIDQQLADIQRDLGFEKLAVERGRLDLENTLGLGQLAIAQGKAGLLEQLFANFQQQQAVNTRIAQRLLGGGF